MRIKLFKDVVEMTKNIMTEVYGETLINDDHSYKRFTIESYLEFMNCKIDLILTDDDVRFNFYGDTEINNISHKTLLKQLNVYYKG